MQAADCLTWDGEHVSRLEQLTGAELDSIRLDFFGRQSDAAGLVRLRLSEHAIHVWDVAVSIDPSATVAQDAIAPAIEQITQLLQFVAKPAGDSFRVRLRTTAPGGDYLLEVGESVSLSDWAESLAVDGRSGCPPRRCCGCSTGGSTRSTPRRIRPRESSWTGSVRCSPASSP